MQPALLDGVSAGASGTVSPSGWSNTDIFFYYMKNHLQLILPFRDADNPTLVLYDGHKSLVSLGLIQWAKENPIVATFYSLWMFLCYGPFENAWNAALHQHLRTSGGITRYDVCKIACKVYSQTLTSMNIQSAFKTCGIFPFNDKVVTDSVVPPSLTFHKAQPSMTTCEKSTDSPSLFLEKRGGEVLSNVKVTKTRKTLSEVVAGKPLTEDDVLDQVKDHIETNKPPKLKEFNKHNNLLKKSYKKSKNLNKSSATSIPKSGTSDPNENGSFSSQTVSDDSETEIQESEKCCICNLFTPSDLKHCVSLTLVKWGQCHLCDRWVHLGFCS